MTDLALYTAVVPRDSQQTRRTQASRTVQLDSTINADFGVVESAGSDPDAVPLTGTLRGKYSDMMASELRELASNDSIKEVPLRGIDETFNDQGYYSIRSADIDQIDPRSPNLQRYDLKLSKSGTRTSHYRAVETSPTDIDNPWESNDNAWVYIAERSENVRWWDGAGNDIEAGVPGQLVTTQFPNAEGYNAADVGFAAPTLVYEVAYDEEHYHDARLYDDRGFTNTRADSDGIRQWQRVMSSTHEFEGDMVFENAKIRVFIDRSTGDIEWEKFTGLGYSSQSMGTDSSWLLRDITFNAIGQAKVEMQWQFEDGTSGDYYHLNVSHQRALDGFLASVPSGEGAIPSALKTELGPLMVSGPGQDAQPVMTTIPKRELNK